MSLQRQETHLFAALWLGTMNDMIPNAEDAREVSDRLFEAGDRMAMPSPAQSLYDTDEPMVQDVRSVSYSSWVH